MNDEITVGEVLTILRQKAPQSAGGRPDMQLAPAITVLLAAAALLWAALMLRRHGIAGILYLACAWIFALADGIVIGQAQYRRSLAANRKAHCPDSAPGVEALEAQREDHPPSALILVTRDGGAL